MSPRRERRHVLSPVTFVVAVVSLVVGMLSAVPPAPAQAAALPGSIVDGGYIISDAEFFDSDSMTSSTIQKFLNGKVTTCKATTGPTCLKSFTTDLPKIAADQYCKAIAAKKGATAAQVIATVAAACGINPKVILVMLQKEQGLVLSSAPSEWSYRAAMGQACPDTAPCDEAAAGFVNQVYKGARQLQVYTHNPTKFNYRAGQTNTIKWHPTSSCGSSKVFIKNQATANLYIYTPYRPNVAALAAGTGTGDSCSTYGNRNFYNFYVSWFAPDASSSTGAPAQVAACTVPVSADITAASGTATLTADTTGKKAPTKNCTSGGTALKKGATVTLTGTYGAWKRVKSGSTTTWVLTSSLKIGTGTPASGSSCALPSESSVTKASGTAVVTTGTLNARKAPTTSCETGKTQIKMGASYPRTATYSTGGAVWWRITVSGSPYWVHSQYVTLKTTSSPSPVPTPNPTPSPGDPAPAPGDGGSTVQTKYVTSPTNLFTERGKGRLVSTLRTGTEATVTSTSGSYAKVTVGRLTGWVETSRLVTRKPATPKTATMQTTGKTTMRVGVSSAAASVSTLAAGTKVTVLESTRTWRAIKVGTTRGWVLASTLGAVSSSKTMKTTSSVNLRASASTSAKVIVTLKKGTKLTVTAKKGSWSKVKVGTRVGWVHSDYLTSTSATSTRTTMTTTVSLNLRASASTSARVITVLAKGTKVTVTAKSGVWRKASVAGRTGWLHSSYLR